MRRGEVWFIADPADPARRTCGLVVSNDMFNEHGSTYWAPIVRSATNGPVPPWAVGLREPDPVSGAVMVGRTKRLPRTAGVEQVGMLTGATLARVAAVLADLFES